ncbi:hypothetical protein MTO96_042126 [Rhipicephalus appendiculatus]
MGGRRCRFVAVALIRRWSRVCALSSCVCAWKTRMGLFALLCQRVMLVSVFNRQARRSYAGAFLIFVFELLLQIDTPRSRGVPLPIEVPINSPPAPPPSPVLFHSYCSEDRQNRVLRPHPAHF